MHSPQHWLCACYHLSFCANMRRRELMAYCANRRWELRDYCANRRWELRAYCANMGRRELMAYWANSNRKGIYGLLCQQEEMGTYSLLCQQQNLRLAVPTAEHMAYCANRRRRKLTTRGLLAGRT